MVCRHAGVSNIQEACMYTYRGRSGRLDLESINLLILG